VAEKPTEAETPMILSRPDEGETQEEFAAHLSELIRQQILDAERTVD
jgi:uncharacterized protein (DUF433 family)